MKKKIRKIIQTTAAASYMALMMHLPALAASTTGVDEVLKPLNQVKLLVLGIFSVVGVIIVAVNTTHLSSALKERDSSSIQTALLGMGGGFIMAAISTVLAFIGL